MNKSEKLLQLVNELAPQKIKDVDREVWIRKAQGDWDDNKDQYHELTTPGLYRRGDDYSGWILFVRKDEVEFFVNYKKVQVRNLLDTKLIRQIFIMRTRISAQSTAIPEIVFFQYLLPIFGAIVTDTQQTNDGQRFWYHAVYKALSDPKKYSIFMLDKRSTPNQKQEITSKEQLDDQFPNIWGAHHAFQQVLVAIVLKTN